MVVAFLSEIRGKINIISGKLTEQNCRWRTEDAGCLVERVCVKKNRSCASDKAYVEVPNLGVLNCKFRLRGSRGKEGRGRVGAAALVRGPPPDSLPSAVAAVGRSPLAV